MVQNIRLPDQFAQQILDELLNDTVITYFEDNLLENILNNDIMYRFQDIEICSEQLS